MEHLKRIGFLSDRTTLAHCVWLNNADIAILVETESTVVHNPLSNLRLGSGIALTDSDYQHWITPRQAVEMASLGGAKGLNLVDKLGLLTVGKQADLVLYDLTNLSLLPCTDPIGLLVLGRPSNVVDSAWVNGKQIVADGKVTTINVDELRQ